MAGLPKGVINSAGRMLKEFNKSTEPTESTKKALTKIESETVGHNTKLDAFQKNLNDINLDTMSPKKALDFLYQVKNSLK